MADRAVQPKCQRERCNHARSFHDGGDGRCLAMGCRCECWWGDRERLMAMSNQDLRQYARDQQVSYRGTSKSAMVDTILSGIEKKKEALSA